MPSLLLRFSVSMIVLLPWQSAWRAAWAEDFRIENKVFVGGEKEPQIQSTTIFHAGMVYDYLKSPSEVIIFDKAHARFVLLDTLRRVMTELSTDEISGLNKNLKDWALSQSDPYLQFLGNPKLEESFDEQTGQLVFSSPWLTYRVMTTDPESDEIARQYRDFSDWSTLLNTRLNPGSKLPFARLLVNESVVNRRQVPKEVCLTMRSKRSLGLAKMTTARSEHQLIRTLVQSDLDRIKQTDEFMGMFRRVDFPEYQKPAP